MKTEGAGARFERVLSLVATDEQNTPVAPAEANK
jgi:hypothetical protein